jgi:hypothetical protein
MQYRIPRIGTARHVVFSPFLALLYSLPLAMSTRAERALAEPRQVGERERAAGGLALALWARRQ